MWGEGGEGKEVGACREEGDGVCVCVCVCVCVKGRQCKKGSVWGCRENYILNQIKAGQLLKQQPHVYIGRCTI